DDVNAEVDGEREQDAGLLSAGREVRLSGVHVRAVLLDQEEPSLYRHGSIEETGTAHLSCDQRRDRTRYRQVGIRRRGWESSIGLIGWANYFCLGAVSKAYSAVDMHAHRRLRRWLCDKHHEPRPGYKRFPEASLNSVYGLVQLPHRTANLPWWQRESFPRAGC